MKLGPIHSSVSRKMFCITRFSTSTYEYLNAHFLPHFSLLFFLPQIVCPWIHIAMVVKRGCPSWPSYLPDLMKISIICSSLRSANLIICTLNFLSYVHEVAIFHWPFELEQLVHIYTYPCVLWWIFACFLASKSMKRA